MSGLYEKGVKAATSAALKIWNEQRAADPQAVAVAAIRAYLTAVGPKAGTVEVKALKWSRDPRGGEQAIAAGLARYRVHPDGDSWYLDQDYMGKGGKSAADADAERRIRSALIPAPSVAEAAEPVAYADFVLRNGHRYSDENEARAAFDRLHPAPSPVVPGGLEALVERFSLSRAGLFGRLDGEWVRHADYAALKAERDEAVAKIEKMEVEAFDAATAHGRTKVERNKADRRAVTAEAAASNLRSVIGHIEIEQATAERDTAAEAHAFKNFHRSLCERFDYTHDEKDWRRDQVSLIEWIASKLSTALARNAEIERETIERCAGLAKKLLDGYDTGDDGFGVEDAIRRLK